MITANKVSIAGREMAGDLDRRSGRKWIYLGGALGVIVLLLLLRAFTGEEKAAPSRPPRPVSVAKVITKDVPLYLDEIGTCAASESVQVQAQVTGQIVERHFKDGADVKKGELLFTIDPKPYQAVLDSARADAMLAQANLKRQEELKAKGVTAPQDLDTARANAERTKAAVAAAQVNLDYCSIRSPINGRTGLRQVDVGNTVTSGMNGAVLVSIDNLDPIYTDFTVAEPDLPLVRRYLGGSTLKVLSDAEGDNLPPRAGKLYFIANTLQPGTGTVQARAITPNEDRALWPSQFVRVRLVLDVLHQARLVPSGAVQSGQNGPYVFVVKKGSTLDLRQVEPGQKQDGGLVVVKKGLQPDETVVVTGQLQLAPGTKVVVEEDEKTSSPSDKKSSDPDAVP